MQPNMQNDEWEYLDEDDEWEYLPEKEPSGLLSPLKKEIQSRQSPDYLSGFRRALSIPTRIAQGAVQFPLDIMNLGQSIGQTLLPTPQGLTEEEREDYYVPAKNPLAEILEKTGVEDFIKPRNNEEEVLQNVLGTVGQFVGGGALLGAASPAPELVTGALFGSGEEAVKASGGGPLAQFVGGLTASVGPGLVKSLFNTGKMAIEKAIDFGRSLRGGADLSKIAPRFLEETGPRALADLELSQRDLAGRIAKTSDETMRGFQDNIGKISSPIEESIQSFDAKAIEKSIVNENVNSVLDTVFPAKGTNQESWKSIQHTVEERYKDSKAAYRNMYETAEEIAGDSKHTLSNTFEAAQSLKKDLRSSLIRAPEEKGLRSVATNLINNQIGPYKKIAKILVEDLENAGIAADYEQVLSMVRRDMIEEGARPVPLKRAMATKRSISRILSKSNIIPAPVDLLKSIQASLKKDIMAGLEATNPRAAKIWSAAEELYGQTQEIFVNPESLKFRKTLLPEEANTQFVKPSNMQRMNSMLGDDVNAKRLFDRLVVQSIGEKSANEASRLANESRQYLSDKANQALVKILEAGDSLTTTGNQALARSALLEDIKNTATTGRRPSTTLDMMRTPVGRTLVKDTLERSPKGREIYKSLQRANAEDFLSSIISEEGQIDFTKAREILRNPGVRRSLEDFMGKEGVEFIEKLDTYGKNLAENMAAFKAKDPTLFDRWLELFANNTVKGALVALSTLPMIKTVTIPTLLASFAGKAVKKKRLMQIMADPKQRALVKKISSKSLSPTVFLANLRKFNDYTNDKKDAT